MKQADNWWRHVRNAVFDMDGYLDATMESQAQLVITVPSQDLWSPLAAAVCNQILDEVRNDG